MEFNLFLRSTIHNKKIDYLPSLATIFPRLYDKMTPFFMNSWKYEFKGFIPIDFVEPFNSLRSRDGGLREKSRSLRGIFVQTPVNFSLINPF